MISWTSPGLNNREQILFSKVMVVEVIVIGNMDLWFELNRHFFSKMIDRVFLDKLLVFQGYTLQVQTHILYILEQVYYPKTRSSAQVWLTVSSIKYSTLKRLFPTLL